MAVKITITKKEEDAIRAVAADPIDTKIWKSLDGLLEKIDVAKTKSTEKKSGYSVRSFIESAQCVFGIRLKVPEKLPPAWFQKMQNFFNTNGVDDVVTATALNAAQSCSEGRDVWIEQLIYSVPKLAAGMSVRLGEFSTVHQKKGGFSPTKSSGWLNRLEETRFEEE